MTTGHRQSPHQNPSGGYTHDDLHRLTDLQRGDLEGTFPDYTGIADTPAKIETFTLDQLGNWNDYDTTLAGVAALDQSRSFNEVNEITDVTDSDPDEDWNDPEYDDAGNMTRSPLIDNESDGARRHVYDAWNRMVEIQFNNSSTVWTLEFDGLNRLIVREKISGTENPTYNHYYNRDWQMLERHKDDTLHWQHVWSQRYIDAPVLWDRDTDDDGQFEKRYYFATDANMNVTALIGYDQSTDTTSVVERYTYDAYGNPRMRFADYSEQGNNRSNHDNHWLFAGYFKLPQDAYHVRNRMYHPTLGAWMQRDPLGYVDGGSLYQYVRSAPLTNRDSRGLWTEKSAVKYLSGRAQEWENTTGGTK